MKDHGRSVIVDELKRELVGPDPCGTGVDLTAEITFPDLLTAKGAFVDVTNGEEILTAGIEPRRRYATGVLFPDGENVRSQSVQAPTLFDELDLDDENENEEFGELNGNLINETLDDDFELSPVNDRDPSSAALTFVIPQSASKIKLTLTGGRYETKIVRVTKSGLAADVTESDELFPDKKGTPWTWWSRKPVNMVFEISVPDSPSGFQKLSLTDGDFGSLSIDSLLLVREQTESGDRFCTLVVRNTSTESSERHCLFQSEFTVTAASSDGHPVDFSPYPDRTIDALKESDIEVAVLDLLYRDQKTYAVGHGCSGDWTLSGGLCQEVRGTYFPTFEAPSITPLIASADGQSLAIKMSDLTDCSSAGPGFQQLENLVQEYAKWIDAIEHRAAMLAPSYGRAANVNIDACRNALRRMQNGLNLLRDNETVRRAFELANEAVLYQQANVPRTTREVTYVKASKKYQIDEPTRNDPHTYGSWRPFQIGYVLSALSSTLDPADLDREVVDLIFFPTGGGKTEAYQALIAISLFHSKLSGKSTGVEVIMRYTLRLLTAQQFLRAASLIACMEVIRQKYGIAGNRFSIGIWVGKATSPLKRDDARKKLEALRKSQDLNHPFVLTRCPHCSTSIGPAQGDAPRDMRWPGLDLLMSPLTGNRQTVVFLCPDASCPFSSEDNPIPAVVIDEDIFDLKPSLVIATLDKFAQVAFNEEIRSLFGLSKDGVRELEAPNLIIQDELHLISGPLGSISGIYETLFEEMCRAGSDEASAKPKIVCSTATIRSAGNQVLGLYGRDKMDVFPPSGLDAGDSFFARYARQTDGSLEQGQLFVGAIGTSLGSVQDLQARVASALLQAPMSLDAELRDPWTTNLAFFNRIQDIGTSFSLLRINARAMLKTLWSRKGVTEKAERRYVNEAALMELTSRIDSNSLPATIERLNAQYPDRQIDICLASNIIEVGIDIQRLSLMTMLGQPKTTSQYIQVAGRVGRDWARRPGLIVVQYPPRRARDRSHFEKFRSFHQRLYANVEPTSVTPWSTPVMERALHAVLVGYIRNFSPKGLEVMPFPEQLFDDAVKIARKRLMLVEPKQLEHFEALVERRREEWIEWRRSTWSDYKQGETNPLLNPAGNYLMPSKRIVTWETMMSMRNVDAECAVKILPHALIGEENV